LYHLSGDKRIEAARHTFRVRRIGIFPAKHTTDVHHGFLSDATAALPRTPRRAATKGLGFGWRWCRSFGMTEKPRRMEKDWMGEMSLPAAALHGASTHRAVLNFPVSGYRFSRPFIRALGL